MEMIECLSIPRKLGLIARGPLLALLLCGLIAASVTLEDYFVFQKDNKKGIRNSQHEVVIPAMYDDLGWSTGEFHPLQEIIGYKENGLWGLMALKNRKISDPLYLNLYPLNRDFLIASKQEGDLELYGIIDLQGNTQLEFEYHRLNLFNNLIIAGRRFNSEVKYGMMNLSFTQVLPYNYSRIQSLNNSYAVITRDEMLGIVNASGQVTVEPRFHDIELKGDQLRGRFLDTYEIRDQKNHLISSYRAKDLRRAAPGVVLATGLGQSQLLNPNGNLVKSYPGTEIFDFNDDRAVIKHLGMFGVIDTHGTVIVSPDNRYVWLDEGYIGIQENGGNWRLMDAELKNLTSRNYQQIKPASEGLFPVKRLDSWGFIDKNGEEVIPPQYQEVGDFESGTAFAKYLGSWGVIDPNGNWQIKPRYEKLEKLDNQAYLYQKTSANGLVHIQLGEVYETANPLKATPTGAIEYGPDQHLALITPNGKKLLSLQYSRILPFKEDPRFYLFEDSLGLGLFNISQHKFFRDTAIQEIRTLSEGFIGVRINNQYGCIDLNGKLRIANRYEDVGIFKEDMLPVKIRGKWGYVDRIERLKVQPLYQSAGHFVNGVAIVSQNQKFGLIDKTGKVVLGLNYDRLERLPEGLFTCYQGSKVGLVDASGKVLVFPRYQSFQVLENGNFIVSKQGKFGLIDTTGKTLIPAEYDEINYDQHNDFYMLAKKLPWKTIDL